MGELVIFLLGTTASKETQILGWEVAGWLYRSW